MKKEIWKNVIGYNDYYRVSDAGRVKSLDRIIKCGSKNIQIKGKFIKGTVNNKGYIVVGLCMNGIEVKRPIHQLVTESFIGHKPNKHKLVVNHKDFNRTNNNISNLEIVSSRVNGNRKHLKSSSKYTGVHWDKNRNKWVAKIKINNKTVSLGAYVNEFIAHVNYELKLCKIK